MEQSSQKTLTLRLVKMAMLIAIAIVLVLLIHLPIIPAVSFLEYDPADIPIIIGGFAFGPVAGIILTVVTAVLQGITVSAGSGFYGIIMHIISTLALVLVSSLIYYKHKTKKRAIVGLACGTGAMIIVMFFANLAITPVYMNITMGITIDAAHELVWTLMPSILLFNLIKAGVNSIVTFFLYKRVSNFLHR